MPSLCRVVEDLAPPAEHAREFASEVKGCIDHTRQVAEKTEGSVRRKYI
jgi:hypothetical protein